MNNLSALQEIHLRVMADLQMMFAELELTEQRHQLIRELDAAILRSTFSPQRVLDLIIQKCLALTGASHGQVVLHRDGRLLVAASSESEHVGEELPFAHSLCGTAVSERTDQHCADVSLLPNGSYVRYHESTKSELVVLIRPANEIRVLGVIDLERDVLGPFSPSALDFAHVLAGQAAIAIEHARIGAGIKTLYEISNSIAVDTLTLQQSCQVILNALLANADFEHGQILLRDADKLVIAASSRHNDISLRPGRDTSVCGRYLLGEEGRSVLVINDIAQSRYADVYLGLLSGEGEPMRSEMIVPLVGDDGSLVGALNIESPQQNVFGALDESFFGAVGHFLAGAISAARVRQRRSQEEQVGTSVLAMTQLGNVASSFLHRFGGAIGNAQNRMSELREHLAERGLPPVSGTDDLDQFIAGIIENLRESAEDIQTFRDRFNPRGAAFQFRSIDLASVGKELVAAYRLRYKDSKIAFSYDNQLPVVRKNGMAVVDSSATCRLTDKVTEVIGNLLDNAVRAVLERRAASDGGQITLSVRLSDGLAVQLRVTDNGVGIPEKEKHLIFTFGHTTRRKKGAAHGIGLWFCQFYALQVGGKLTFGSVEGKGSWFELEFPAIEP